MKLEIILALTLLTAAHNAGAEAPRFSLDASVITAIENGPIVVKATLTYRGNDPVSIIVRRKDWTNAFVTGPVRWKYQPAGEVEILNGQIPRDPILKLNRDESIVDYVPVHRDFPDANGTGIIMVHWDVHQPTEREAEPVLPVKLTREVKVVVEKENERSFRDLIARHCKALDESTESRDAFKTAWAHIKGCPRKELLPLAIRLLDAQENESEQGRVMMHIFDLKMPEMERKKALIEYLMKPHPRSFAAVFHFWSYYRPDESSATFPELIELADKSTNVWVRVLAAVVLQERLDERRQNRIEEEIRTTFTPKSSPEFVEMLADLDSARFQTREKATKKLVLCDEAVERMICQVLVKSQPPEVDQRLRKALKDLQSRDPSPESFSAIQELYMRRNSSARKFLKLISDGPTDLRSTCEAKRLLLKLAEEDRNKK